MNRLYFCFPLSGPKNGVRVISEAIFSFIKDNGKWDLIPVDTAQANDFSSFGKFALKKVIAFFKMAFRALVFRNQSFVYINLTPKGFAFFRDVVLIYLLRLKRCKITAHVHANGLENKVNPILKAILKNVNIITINQRQHNSLFDKGIKTHLIPNAMPDTTMKNFKISQGNNRTKLLYFSNLSKEKGIDRLYQLSEVLDKVETPIHLSIYGGVLDEYSKEKLNELTKVSKSKVSYYGPCLNDEEKKRIFEEHGFLILLSDENYEVYPLVYIEALMYGIPIFSTHQIVGNRLKDLDVLQLAVPFPDKVLEQCSHYYKNESDYLILRKKCRSVYENEYNFPQFVKQIEKIIKS